MRPNSLLGAVLLVTGGAWLAFKAEYLRLEASYGLQALLIAPGVVALIGAAFVFFPDARRRLGGSLLAIGAVVGLWLVLDPRTHSVFYEYPGVFTVYGESRFVNPDPVRSSVASLGIAVGLALLFYRSVPGGVLLGGAVLTGFFFTPVKWMESRRYEGMDRYEKYYVPATPPSPRWGDGIAPALLALGGTSLLLRRPKPPISGA